MQQSWSQESHSQDQYLASDFVTRKTNIIPVSSVSRHQKPCTPEPTCSCLYRNKISVGVYLKKLLIGKFLIIDSECIN